MSPELIPSSCFNIFAVFFLEKEVEDIQKTGLNKKQRSLQHMQE